MKERTIAVWLGSDMEQDGFTREEVSEAFVEVCDTYAPVLLVPHFDGHLSWDELVIKNNVISSWRSAGAEIWEFMYVDGRGFVFFDKYDTVKVTF